MVRRPNGSDDKYFGRKRGCSHRTWCLRHGGHSSAGPESREHSCSGALRIWTRLPLLVVSPWARQNFVDHSVTDQSSIIRFIEGTWLGGTRIGQGSFDGIASSISQMFDFTRPRENRRLLLDPNTGERVGD